MRDADEYKTCMQCSEKVRNDDGSAGRSSDGKSVVCYRCFELERLRSEKDEDARIDDDSPTPKTEEERR